MSACHCLQVDMTGQVVPESAIKEEYAKLAGQTSKSGSQSMKRTVINMGRASTDAKKAKTEEIKYVNQSDIVMAGWGDEESEEEGSTEEEKEKDDDPEPHKQIKMLLQHIIKIGEEAAEALQTLK